MRFYVNPEKAVEYPCFILDSTNWDDFTNKTSFSLSYFEVEGSRKNIGPVKIMHVDTRITIQVIPSEFNELIPEFCSLGQEVSYYEKLSEAFPDNYESILDILNDAAFFPAVAEEFENHERFRLSLIRFSEAEQAFRQAKKIIENIPLEKAFQFTYKGSIENINEKFVVHFNFADNSLLPNRIIGLVGKNGTGKTQFLAKLALDLSGKSRKIKDKSSLFHPYRPLFSKIIAVSYSAFDKFSRPTKDKSFSYKYCGLKDEKGNIISRKKLADNYKEAVTKIKELKREDSWSEAVSSIIGNELSRSFSSQLLKESNYDILENNIQNLSSGQNYLIYVITEVIANIRIQSLLLFDEPEMHLHPNAIANLVRMLDELLKEFDSYAIIATHSPIIIQEIPSRYVFVFERQGNTPIVRKLGLESFGESLEVLIEEVFQTKDVRGTYKEVFEELRRFMTYDQVLKLFDNKLSLTAKTFLLGLYNPSELKDA